MDYYELKQDLVTVIRALKQFTSAKMSVLRKDRANTPIVVDRMNMLVTAIQVIGLAIPKSDIPDKFKERTLRIAHEMRKVFRYSKAGLIHYEQEKSHQYFDEALTDCVEFADKYAKELNSILTDLKVEIILLGTRPKTIEFNDTSKVMTIFHENPHLSVTAIAKKAGVHRTKLYKMTDFLEAREVFNEAELKSRLDSKKRGYATLRPF